MSIRGEMIMNRTKWFSIILVVLVLFLQGCKQVGMDTDEKIMAPKNTLIPLRGTWEIEKYKVLGEPTMTIGEINQWIGKTAEFNKEFAILGEEVCIEPEYKIKNVNTRNYFLYTYKVNYQDLDINDNDIDVVSITAKDQPFYDFIKINENQLMICSDNTFYYLKKISENTDQMIEIDEKSQASIKSEDLMEEKYLLRSGVLLGLRNDNKSEKDSYRTLWIASINRVLHPVLAVPDLFLPRKSGFWMTGIDRQQNNDYFKDVLFAYPLENNLKNIEIQKDIVTQKNRVKENNLRFNMARKILFVANDYIITEYGETLNYQLQVLPIDNINNNEAIKISDIAGESGRNALIASGNTYLSSLSKNEFDQLEKEPREESFSMARRNGYWIMKGRLNSESNAVTDKFGDFNINLIPPTELINYNELCVSWNKIKAKVPKALDAYTSPNKDLALIICKDVIYVYTIKNNHLSNKPVQEIEIQTGESVVMAEWATADYVERWEAIFREQVKA